MKNVGLYVRVSTSEQKAHGLSVDNQIEALKNYCAMNNYNVVNVYNDAGFSARKSYKRRPALQSMIQDCQKGLIDLILFTKLDRFFRSVPDYYACIEQLNNVPWRAIWEDYETETPGGVLRVNIMLSVAQNEADNASARVKAVIDFKRARGDYVGKAPTGYIVSGRELVKDPQTEAGVTAMLNEYLTSFSISKASNVAMANGIVMDRIHLTKLIKNPAYCGETAQGYICEPYITPEQHQMIINRVGCNPRTPKIEGRVYLLSGKVICGYCGGRMAGHTVKRTYTPGNTKTYIKYECLYASRTGHPHLQIVEHQLEEHLLNRIDDIVKDKIVEVEKVASKTVGVDVAKRKAYLDSKLKRLATLYMDGDMDVDEYRSKRDSIKKELLQLTVIDAPAPAPLPEEWKQAYELLDREHQRAFWNSILKSITVTNETKSDPIIDLM